MDAYYATIVELQNYSLNPQVIANYNFTEDSMNAAIAAASADVNSYLRSQQILPLTSWDAKIIQVTCDIAAYRLFKNNGFDPAAVQNANIKGCYDEAMTWLNKVAEQLIIVQYPDSSDQFLKAGPFVRTARSPVGFGQIYGGPRWR